ncbi:MAG: PAS domain S-box protein [Gemmatimonadota bacterium]
MTIRHSTDDDVRHVGITENDMLSGGLSEHALLRIVTENARVGLVIVSRERRYTYANGTYAELLALAVENLVGKRLEDVLAGVYEEQVRPRLDRAFAGERVDYELHRPSATGERFYSVRYEPTIVDGTVAYVVVVIIDITERRQTQTDSSRFAAIVATSDDAIISKDLSGDITSWNAGAERLFGYAATEMVGASIMQLIPDERRDEELEILAKIRRNESVRHFETQRRRKDGRLIDVSVTASPIRDEVGRVIGVSKVARDISDRKAVEQALRLERDRAQRYLDAADVILLALDNAGNITLINRKGCDILGRGEAELLGRPWIDTCLPARVRDTMTQKFNHLVSGDVRLVENLIVTKSGDERLIEWRNSVLHDDFGNVIGTLSSGTDNTERNNAIEALRVAEERMRFALENAGVGIWDQDYATGVARVSDICLAHHGMTPGTFGGTFDAFIEAVHPEDRAHLTDTIKQAIASGGDFSAEFRALWPDGTVRWLSNTGRIQRGDHGEPIRGVGISMDITARRSLEAQYHQAQKMEAVGRLAGGVAHDFNNLLTGILGYCQLVLGDLAPGSPLRNDIEQIQKAGESAAGLTRQLLAFSRKQVIEPTLLDLNVVIGNMRGLLARVIGEDVRIVFKFRPGLAAVTADAGQMEQVIMNLAVNARDAMPGGGTIVIETANVQLDAEYARTHFAAKPGRYVALTISDTGSGMPAEVKDRLFEPFFTTKEIGKGTGLGLATVHGIVTRSDGSINVQSELGVGTTFTIYLPCSESSAVAAGPAPGGERQRSKGETVLLVEDAEGLRTLIKRILERQGYGVLVASSAGEALELFERHTTIDLVLTDVIMPGGNGAELTRRLVAQRPDIRVVHMSGYTEDAITHQGVLQEGIDFLQKPFTSEALGRKLREVLDR